jgi:hypothetical protein
VRFDCPCDDRWLKPAQQFHTGPIMPLRCGKSGIKLVGSGRCGFAVETEMRAELKTHRVLDDRAIPNGVQVGGLAEIGQFDFVSTTVMVVVFGMHWLMNVADEMHNPFQRLKPRMLIGGGVGKDNREVDDFCHDTVSVSAIPCRIVIRRGKRNIDEMPVCCIPALRTDLIRPRCDLIKTMMSVQ